MPNRNGSVAAADPLDLGDLELWKDGPPHAIFERLRREDPVHWSPMATWEGEPGFWSTLLANLGGPPPRRG